MWRAVNKVCSDSDFAQNGNENEIELSFNNNNNCLKKLKNVSQNLKRIIFFFA
jgi:hypothetical protein